jgi:APA family basic amino acid/polyamine antiporter
VAVTKGLLAVALATLAAVVAAGWSSPAASLGRLTPIDASVAGILRSAGFLFFAFAGYARIATLGEEVRDPATTIPRAIPRALAAVLVVYAAVGVTVLAVVPVPSIAASDAPLRLVVAASRFEGLGAVVRVGAGIAALGVLLNLLPGVSRTVLAMARRRELPTWLATVDARRSLPLRAELTVAALVVALTVLVDLRGAIGFSGVTILTYYAITNRSALTLAPAQRRWPRWIAVAGLIGCVVLAAMLPVASIVAGVAVLSLGIAFRAASSFGERRSSDR